MRNILQTAILCISAFSLISCTNDQLETFNIDGQSYQFELSNKFKNKLYQYDATSYFDNGDFLIEVDITYKPDDYMQKVVAEYRTDLKKTYSNMRYMTFHRTDLNIQNKRGFSMFTFYGKGKDKSVIWPSYFEGYYIVIETPKHYVKITMVHNSWRENAMDKEQAINYLTPMLETFREGNYY